MLQSLKKAYALMDSAARRQSVWLLGLILFGSLMEAVGVGIVFPFIKLIEDPALIDTIKILQVTRSVLSVDDKGTFLALVGVGLIFVFIIKNITTILINKSQTNFSQKNASILSYTLFKVYIYADYFHHLNTNSSEMIQNAREAAMNIYTRAIIGFIRIVTDVAIITAIFLVLLFAQPVMTLAAMLIQIIGLAMFSALYGPVSVRLGRSRLLALETVLKWLQQSLGGIKDVRVRGREIFFLSQYSQAISNVAEIQARQEIISQLPRIIFEMLTVSSLLLVSVMMLLEGQSGSNVIATLGLFAAAGLRLMPCISRITVSLNDVRGCRAAIDKVHGDLQALSRPLIQQPPVGVVPLLRDGIAVNGLSFTYPKALNAALKGIDLNIGCGQMIGLVGPSGGGKSTFVDLVLGLLAPQAGSIRVDGVDIGDGRDWRRQVGYVPQTIFLTDDTLARNIAFGMNDEDIDPQRLAHVVSLAQLEHLVAQLPAGLQTMVGEAGARLSGGQRQRVGIARALYHDPQVLVLDEATSALDNETEESISKALDGLRGEKTILVVAHRLSTVQHCDAIAFLVDGRLAGFDTFTALKQQNAHFRRLVELGQLDLDPVELASS